jgi:hypothetical protein
MTNNRKWMHTEVKGHDLKTDICRLMKERGLDYEPSGMGDDWYHIAVFCTEEEATELNGAIMDLDNAE